MFLVLTYLVEHRPAKSGEVAEGLGFISPKYASLVLTRCYRRGFVSRQPYKRGRERGYAYELTDKGTEWILYKVDQRGKARQHDQNDRKPRIEVEESTGSPRVEMLTLKQNQKDDRDFTSLEVRLPTLAACAHERAYRSLKQQYVWAIVAFEKCSSERDLACYLCSKKWEEKLEASEKSRHREATPSIESLHEPCSSTYERALEYFNKGWHHGFYCGLRFGEAFGRWRERRECLAELAEAALKKKTRALTGNRSLQEGKNQSLRFQKRDAQANTVILNNTQTPAKSLSSAFPLPSTQTINTMRNPTGDLRMPPSFSKGTGVEETIQDEEDWTDMNSWWRHL